MCAECSSLHSDSPDSRGNRASLTMAPAEEAAMPNDQDVASWLEARGFGQYAEAFEVVKEIAEIPQLEKAEVA